MNPRQRQGLLLVVIAAVGLLGVFLLIANYVSSVSKQVGPKVSILRLVRTLPPYQPVTADDLGEVSVPQKWAPHNAMTDPSQALNQISLVQLPAGEDLETGMLGSRPALAPGRLEIAILVDAETGVANQVEPGDLVDLIATYQGSNGQRSSAQVVVPSVEVLGVGQTAATSSGSTGSAQTSGLPVTLSLTPAQALKVSYAQSFSQKLRLAIIAPNSGAAPVTAPTYTPATP